MTTIIKIKRPLTAEKLKEAEKQLIKKNKGKGFNASRFAGKLKGRIRRGVELSEKTQK